MGCSLIKPKNYKSPIPYENMEYHLIGYGSLMSHQSLRETIPDKHFTPVIVKGYKRIFNLAEKNGDVLNLIKSRKSFFNGVLFKVNEKELIKIKKREDEYNLEETSAYDFLTKKKLCKCLIVTDNIISIDRKKRKPDKSYFTLCRESAYHISKEFGRYWDNTSFISNGQKVSNWIKNHPEYQTL